MNDAGARILIIDDEPQIRKLLRVNLQAHGFAVGEAMDGEEGIRQMAVVHPDLVVLDLGLPHLDGMEIIQRIREWSEVPIIVLTARDKEKDKIMALDQGADDYVTKPFGMGELVARIRAALRREAGGKDEPILALGPLAIDFSRRRVELGGDHVKLTPTEYELLKALAVNAGRVLTHRQLLRQVWGRGEADADNYSLRVYIGHLRKKIEKDPARPEYILTEPGIGYRLVVE